MNINISSVSKSDKSTVCQVVFVSQMATSKSKGSSKKPAVKYIGKDKGLANIIKSESKKEAFSGAAGECTFYRQTEDAHLLVVGLGDSKKVTHEDMRRNSAALLKSLRGHNVKSASIDMATLGKTPSQLKGITSAMAEGFEMASYSFDELKEGGKKSQEKISIDLCFSSSASGFKKAIEDGQTIGDAVNLSRRLGDMPGNYMNPTLLAKEVQKEAKGSKLKVTIWDKARIKKEKMGGLLGVSAGSDQDPRFIIMEYQGAAKSKKPVCFVGKGLTFDCGGISIKPSAGMADMKYDMCGGANVIGTMMAIARLKLKVNAIAFVPSSENLTGGSATKPGDVLVARNGKTIEVNNTDAEGRLILADALSYASEKKPAFICDVATLTGAMMVALGGFYTGYFTEDEKLNRKIKKAYETSGEDLWHMPLNDLHKADMKGTYADLTNLPPGRGGGSSTAAGFLSYFVDKDIPWAHFDIAGTAWHASKINYCPPKGASGVVVRSLVELARQHK